MRTTIAAFPLFGLALGSFNFQAFDNCVTQSGTSSVKSVSTSVATTTVRQPDLIVKHTYNPKYFVTPRPFTRTWTHTFHETNTAVSTVTIVLTHIDYVPTSTIVSTSTQTHVSNVYTNIPAPAGFLPIQNTTNSAYPAIQSAPSLNATLSSAHGQNMTVTKAASMSASAHIEARDPKLPFPNIFGQQFAHAVHCLKSVLVQNTVQSTVTGPTQTSTLDRPTTTMTVSTTTTAMVQPKPGHGKTVYTTAWTTVTKNYNVYSTSTVNAEVTSTIKAYAACKTNNMLGAVASIAASGSNKPKYKTTVARSAERCCEQCMETTDCIGSAFQEILPIGGRCLIYTADTCPSQSASSLEYFTSGSRFQVGGVFTASNGLCGFMYSGGQVEPHAHGKGWA